MVQTIISPSTFNRRSTYLKVVSFHFQSYSIHFPICSHMFPSLPYDFPWLPPVPLTHPMFSMGFPHIFPRFSPWNLAQPSRVQVSRMRCHWPGATGPKMGPDLYIAWTARRGWDFWGVLGWYMDEMWMIYGWYLAIIGMLSYCYHIDLYLFGMFL